MSIGEIVELEVGPIAHGGVCVARHDGRVIFVSDALPGEKVAARISDDSQKSFWRADTVAVIEASEHRRDHIWALADVSVDPQLRPGGVEFGHADLDYQRELKRQVLHDAMLRFGKSPEAAALVQFAPAGEAIGENENPEGLAWRTRLSLHADEAGNIGPYAARSHRVIPVSEHPLAIPAISRAIERLYAPGAGGIDLVAASDGHVRIINRKLPEPSRGRGRRGVKHVPDAGINSKDPAFQPVIERLGAHSFTLDAGGFWQVHRLAAATLAQLVADAIDELGGIDPQGQNLDLYGGVGLFAAVMALSGGEKTRVITVEADARASDHAGSNLAEWIGARAINAKVDRWLQDTVATASPRERARLSAGIVLLDPPRSGAGAKAVTAIAELDPKGVIYIACDPVALARDTATFIEAGYRVKSVRGVDLFPNSHHSEQIAVFSRD